MRVSKIIVCGVAVAALAWCGSSDAAKPPAEASKPVAKKGDYCSAAQCRPGTQVKLKVDDDFGVFLCPTEQLASYVNTVIAFTILAAQKDGAAPPLSPKTGEPSFKGRSKAILDILRPSAGVATFDDAFARCVRAKNGMIFTVMNSEKSNVVMRLMYEGKGSTWAPKVYFVAM